MVAFTLKYKEREMIELADEIGREHISALAVLAQTKPPLGDPHDGSVLCAVGNKTKKYLTEDQLRGLEVQSNCLPYITEHVRSKLESLGFVTTSSHQRVPAARCYPHETADHTVEYGDVFAMTYYVKITARGRDLLDRRILCGILGVFSAKTNKWICFGLFAVAILSFGADLKDFGADLKDVAQRVLGHLH